VISAARAFSPAAGRRTARGNGQHVLDGAAHFHAHHVVIGVDTQRGAVKGGDQRVAHFGMFAGGDQRRRLAARDFQRKAGPAEHARS
jgi:hypothetical protein